MSGAPLGRCAVHPDLIAQAICARCGNFMCNQCQSPLRSELCGACAVLTGATPFPLQRDDYDLRRLLAVAFERWKQRWRLLAVLFVATRTPSLAVGVLGFLSFHGDFGAQAWYRHMAQLGHWPPIYLSRTVLELALTLLVLGVQLDLLEGRRLSLQAAFARTLRLPAALLQRGVATAAVALLSLFAATSRAPIQPAADLLSVATFASEGGWIEALLFAGQRFYRLGHAVPDAGLVAVGLAFASGFVFCLTELTHDPSCSAGSALTRCARLVEGHRGRVFGICLLARFIGVSGALTGVGLLLTEPLGDLICCALFLALKNRHAPEFTRAPAPLDEPRAGTDDPGPP